MPAAAAVWQSESGPTQDTLGTLLDYSLLDWDPETQRYRIHDLARDLADRLLSEEDRANAQQRHATYFLDMLLAANHLYLEGAEQMMRGLALFDLDWSNIQAGQVWAQAHAEEDDAAAALCNRYPGSGALLELRRHPRDRILWLESALAAARRLQDRQAEGQHLGNLGIAYRQLGENQRAIEIHEQRLLIARETRDRQGEGNALDSLGNSYSYLGDPLRAIEYHEQALAIHHEIGDRRSEGHNLGNLGIAYRQMDDPRRGIVYFEQALAIHQEIGDRVAEGYALANLGIAYRQMGDRRRAIEYYEQALTIDQNIGDRRGEAIVLWNMALALHRIRDRGQAIERAEASLRLMEEIEDPSTESVRELLAEWRVEKGSGFFPKLLSLRRH